jgi:hypothetical protein
VAEFEDEKFIVLPMKYVNEMPSYLQADLGEVLSNIAWQREQQGFNPEAKYYVCNRDEPYAEEVLRVILTGEEDKEDEQINL